MNRCPPGRNPLATCIHDAVIVMAELGVNISAQSSKSIYDFLPPEGIAPDVVIGVCSAANENCPVFPGAVERWHWPFDDPFHAAGSEEEQMSEFRRVRDEIKARLEKEFGP